MLSEDEKRSFVKNSAWQFLSSIVNRIGALIFVIILARFLQPEGYGIYSIVLSTAMIFYTFADLGINSALVRYLSYSISKNKKAMSAYYRYLFKMKFYLSLGISLIFLILAYPLATYVFKNNALLIPFLVSAGYIFILSFEGFYTQIFYSLERVEYIGLKEIISQFLRISFALVIFYLVAYSYYIVGIFISFSLISIILLVFSLYYLKKLIPEIFEKKENGFLIDRHKILRFVGWLTIASISGVFYAYVDSIMLGIFLKPEFVGYYRAAFSLVNSVVAFVLAPVSILLPIFTKIEKKGMENSVNMIIKYILIFGVPAVFGLVVLGKYFIRLFYGYSYLPASIPLYFLSFSILFSVYTAVLLQMFSAREKPQFFAMAIVVTSTINIVLNYILIKSLMKISEIWAMNGAAIASLVSLGIYLGSVVYFSKKEFKIKVSFKPMIKPLIASIMMAGIVFYLVSLFKDITILSGIVIIFVGVVVYFLIMIAIGGVKKEDLILLKKIV
ncbi:MAG: flippase [Candidatus Pacearchaeota archaeon]|nr:flippase [Candidatus Pacearchaeota archaeon]